MHYELFIHVNASEMLQITYTKTLSITHSKSTNDLHKHN